MASPPRVPRVSQADEIGMASMLELSGIWHEYMSDVDQSAGTEGSGPLGGVGPSVLGAVNSSEGTRPPGPGVDDADPVVCDPVVCDPGVEDLSLIHI